MRRKVDPNLPKTPEKALDILRWLCSKMERCRADARTSLYRWHVDPAAHDDIIDKLVEEKFIDDERYARAFVGEKLRTKSWGVTKIAYALKIKHIDNEIIASALEEQVDKQEMKDNLLEQLTRRAATEFKRETDKYKVKAKLFRWAASRGFDMGEINHTIEKIMKDE